MSLKKLITYTEDVGPEISEFEIESKQLSAIVKDFIGDYADDFDEEDGQMLKVRKDTVMGVSPVGIYPMLKSETIDCIADLLLEIGIDDENIELIREKEQDIIDNVISIRWTTVSRDLASIDIEANIENIDDGILEHINERDGTSLSRDEAMKDDAFREAIKEYMEEELAYLILIVEYLYVDGKETRTVKIGNAD